MFFVAGGQSSGSSEDYVEITSGAYGVRPGALENMSFIRNTTCYGLRPPSIDNMTVLNNTVAYGVRPEPVDAPEPVINTTAYGLRPDPTDEVAMEFASEAYGSSSPFLRLSVRDVEKGYPYAFPARQAIHCALILTDLDDPDLGTSYNMTMFRISVYVAVNGSDTCTLLRSGNVSLVELAYSIVVGEPSFPFHEECFTYTWDWSVIDRGPALALFDANESFIGCAYVPVYYETSVVDIASTPLMTGFQLSATIVFRNFTDIFAVGETVRFYLNGSLVGTTTVNELGRAVVTVQAPPGFYLVTVEPEHGVAVTVPMVIRGFGYVRVTWTAPEFQPVAPSYTTVTGILMTMLWLALAIVLVKSVGVWPGLAITSFLISVYGVIADIPLMFSAGIAGIVASLIMRRVAS